MTGRGYSQSEAGAVFPAHVHRLGLWQFLQEGPELLGGKPGIRHYTPHGEGVDRLVAWDREEAAAVGHHDMLAALSDNPEPRFLEGTDRRAVVDARN